MLKTIWSPVTPLINLRIIKNSFILFLFSMVKFFTFEVKNLFDLYQKEVATLDIPSHVLETATINLAKDIDFYLRYCP